MLIILFSLAAATKEQQREDSFAKSREIFSSPREIRCRLLHEMTFEKYARASKERFNIYIFSRNQAAPCRYCIISRRNGLFSFIRMSRRVRRAVRRCCTLHFSANHTESHMPAAQRRQWKQQLLQLQIPGTGASSRMQKE